MLLFLLKSIRNQLVQSQTSGAFLQDSVVHPNIFSIFFHSESFLHHNILRVHKFEHKFRQILHSHPDSSLFGILEFDYVNRREQNLLTR